MASRANLGLVAWIGVIIVIGLLITHAQGVKTEGDTFFGGVGSIIKDLQSPPQGH